jgi:hypothetical protein
MPQKNNNPKKKQRAESYAKPNIIETHISCTGNGRCKQEHCELWDPYTKTCCIRAILYELREQTIELKLRRRYLRKKTLKELAETEDEDLLCDEETLRGRNSLLLRMLCRPSKWEIQQQKPNKKPK